jgi:hypothetical protein
LEVRKEEADLFSIMIWMMTMWSLFSRAPSSRKNALSLSFRSRRLRRKNAALSRGAYIYSRFKTLQYKREKKMKREKDIKNSRTHLREEGIVLQSIWGEKSENFPSLFPFAFVLIFFNRIFVVFPSHSSLTPLLESRKRIVVMM